MKENFFDSIAKVCDSAVETPKAQPKRQPAAPIRRRAPRVADAARSYRVKVSVRHARDFYDALVDGRFKFTQEASDVFVVRADKDEIRDIAAQVGIPQDEYEVEKGIRDAAGADDFKVGDKVSITGPEAHRRSDKLYGKEGVVKEYAPVNNLIVVDIDGNEQALHPSVCKKIGDAAGSCDRRHKIGDFRNRIIERPLLLEVIDYHTGLDWLKFDPDWFKKQGSGDEMYYGAKATSYGVDDITVRQVDGDDWVASLRAENGVEVSGEKASTPEDAVRALRRSLADTIRKEEDELAQAEERVRVRYKLGDSTLLSQEQLEANNPAWVADKEKWTEAVAKATDGGTKEVEGTLVAALYKKLGGSITGKTTDAANSEDWVLVYDGDKSQYLIRNYFKYESPFTTDLTRAIHFATEKEAKDYARQRGLFFIPQKNEPTGVKDAADDTNKAEWLKQQSDLWTILHAIRRALGKNPEPMINAVNDRFGLDIKNITNLAFIRMDAHKASNIRDFMVDQLTEEQLEEAYNYAQEFIWDSADRNYIFPAGSAAVIGSKGHFPLSDVGQARNALAQVAKYDKLPEWYDGKMTLEEFKKFVRDAVAKAFPSIEVTDSQGCVKDSFEEEIGITEDMSRDDAHDKLREYLDANNHSEEAIKKVARVLLERGEESLKQERGSWKELMAVSTTQNGKPQYSYKQKAWTVIEDEVTDDATSDADRKLEVLQKWATNSVGYISERTDYMRGYKEGLKHAQQFVLEIIDGKKE